MEYTDDLDVTLAKKADSLIKGKIEHERIDKVSLTLDELVTVGRRAYHLFLSYSDDKERALNSAINSMAETLNPKDILHFPVGHMRTKYCGDREGDRRRRMGKNSLN